MAEKDKKTKKTEQKDALAKRTIQIIGFGSAFVLFVVKIGLAIASNPAAAEIPWYLAIGAFGVGVC